MRWPGGRQRAGGRPGPPVAPATGRDDPGDGLSGTGAQIFDRILAASTGGRNGLLHLVGDPGGLVYLGDGRVLLVQTRAVPGIELLLLHRTRPRDERPDLLAAMATSEGRDTASARARRILESGQIPPLELDVLHQQAVADAAAALLVAGGTTLTRSRFFRGEQPWTHLSAPVTVDDLVTEAVRRRRLLDRAAGTVGPGSRPLRSTRLPVEAVRLTARQWELVTLADGRRSVRDLAWILGQGLCLTTRRRRRSRRGAPPDRAPPTPVIMRCATGPTGVRGRQAGRCHRPAPVQGRMPSHHRCPDCAPGTTRDSEEPHRMAAAKTPPPPPDFTERIVDIDVEQEMQGAFLEYAYSVIYSRALPDARDGLKPVQRRILYQMSEMGLRPERGHVKSSRVVGDVMGRLHPHGDAAIYDALVRLAQPFTLRLPLVDGHGNFGSLDDGPAAARYTEVRMAPSAMLMTDGLDEDTVDFVPNYDNSQNQPDVLPAAFPNLLVNGASGIAVGMATNMPPHNLVEVVGAARHLISHPDATLDDLMRFVPGPDLPTGGRIVGLDGIREAYASGRGTFRTRAAARIESITARRQGIVVTELPYLVGPEKVIDKITDLVKAKRLTGISDVTDLSDREKGLRLVIEIKGGFNPEAVLEQLYRLTPMEDSFGINNVALVEGQPRTLGLREMLDVFVRFRFDVVRRRTTHRRQKAADRLHLVEGLLVAILDIDEVIAVIRGSDDTAQARERLISVFDLSLIQTDYILEMPLRRLTKYSKLELDKEKTELEQTIAGLTAILEDDGRLRQVVSGELSAVAKAFGTPRRTVLLESAGLPAVTSRSAPLEVSDDPCWVLLSSTGLLARTGSDEPLPTPDAAHRSQHDLIVSCVRATARGEIAVLTNTGRMVRLPVVDMPTLPPTSTSPSLSGGAPVPEFLALEKGERVVSLATLATDSPGIALGTAQGVVKRVTVDYPSNKDTWEIIALREGDEVVGAVELRHDECDLVFVTSDAQLLRFGADKVRPQGRAAGGMAGVNLAKGARVIFFGAVDLRLKDGEWASVVVTIAGTSDALPGTETGTAKVTPFAEYPGKGRATGGVRCHRFLKGEDTLVLAWAGPNPALAAAPAGVPVPLPAPDSRRDGSGVPLARSVDALAGATPTPASAATGPALAGTSGGSAAEPEGDGRLPL